MNAKESNMISTKRSAEINKEKLEEIRRLKIVKEEREKKIALDVYSMFMEQIENAVTNGEFFISLRINKNFKCTFKISKIVIEKLIQEGFIVDYEPHLDQVYDITDEDIDKSKYFISW